MQEIDWVKIEKTSRSHGSFAVWKQDDIDNLTVIKNESGQLHGRVIFVGLNPSGKIPEFLRNFHKKHRGGRDSWLAKSIGLDPVLRGAYMTDFHKEDFAVTENQVQASQETNLRNLKILNEEINIFKEYRPKLVAFGHKTFDVLSGNGFKPEYLPHYSSRSRISWKEFSEAVKILGNKIKIDR